MSVWREKTLYEMLSPLYEGEALKRAILYARLGNMPIPSDEMLAICHNCHWRGTIAETQETAYVSSGIEWASISGRKGRHYLCPKCREVIWRIYDAVS